MPKYTFWNTMSDEYEDRSMSYKDLDKFLEDNPHLTQTLSTPAFGHAERLGIRKGSDAFQDLLKNMKRRHKHNTINTRS